VSIEIPAYYVAASKHIAGSWLVVNAVFDGLWDLLHRGHIVRRSVLAAGWVLTFQTYYWCFDVAEKSAWNPATVGACFGILTPLSALMGFVQKMYNAGRISNGDGSNY
jgi:hypothetical protein